MTAGQEVHYVVLHHTGWGDAHFDLLLETSPDGPLESYRISQWPPSDATVVQRNVPHRRLYLHYEGPVSGGRGVVRRIAKGSCRRLESVVVFENSILLPLTQSE